MKLPSFSGKDRKEEARQKRRLIDAITGKAARQGKQALRERKQLNVKVDARLKGFLQRLAAKFSVHRDIIAEHALELGTFYLERIQENEEAFNTVRRHLVDDHQLGNKIIDNESILRLGESNNISELLDQVEPVIKSWYQFKRAVAIAQKTENITYLEIYEKQLRRSVITFANWLEQNRLDKP